MCLLYESQLTYDEVVTEEIYIDFTIIADRHANQDLHIPHES